MLEFFQFATSGFWVFVGTVIILALIGKIVAIVILGLAAILRGKGETSINIE